MSVSEKQAKRTKKKYRCIAHGYDNVKVREPGEIFEFDGEPAPWMKEIKDSETGEVEESKAATRESKRAAAKPTGDAEVI